MIVEAEMNELLSSLNLYEQVFDCLREFQELWIFLNALFDEYEIQMKFKEENKR